VNYDCEYNIRSRELPTILQNCTKSKDMQHLFATNPSFAGEKSIGQVSVTIAYIVFAEVNLQWLHKHFAKFSVMFLDLFISSVTNERLLICVVSSYFGMIVFNNIPLFVSMVFCINLTFDCAID